MLKSALTAGCPIHFAFFAKWVGNHTPPSNNRSGPSSAKMKKTREAVSSASPFLQFVGYYSFAPSFCAAIAPAMPSLSASLILAHNARAWSILPSPA